MGKKKKKNVAHKNIFGYNVWVKLLIYSVVTL